MSHTECEVCEEGCKGWWDCDPQNKGKTCDIHCLEEMCCECKYLGRYKKVYNFRIKTKTAYCEKGKHSVEPKELYDHFDECKGCTTNKEYMKSMMGTFSRAIASGQVKLHHENPEDDTGVVDNKVVDWFKNYY